MYIFLVWVAYRMCKGSEYFLYGWPTGYIKALRIYCMGGLPHLNRAKLFPGC